MAKKIVGVVTSDVRDKTITITVTRRETHPIYGKQYTVTRKFTAHDEKNEAKKGDKVEIGEVKPISKTKSWSLTRVVELGHGEIELKEEPAAAAPVAQAPEKAPAAKKKAAEEA